MTPAYLRMELACCLILAAASGGCADMFNRNPYYTQQVAIVIPPNPAPPAIETHYYDLTGGAVREIAAPPRRFQASR